MHRWETSAPIEGGMLLYVSGRGHKERSSEATWPAEPAAEVPFPFVSVGMSARFFKSDVRAMSKGFGLS